MKRQARRIETELAVIGTGIAGCAAALFARARGIEVAQFGHSGAMAYTTGYLDLLGAANGQVLDDPWAGLDALRHAEPDHPMARLSNSEIRAALGAFVDSLTDMGVCYTPPGDRNLPALLPFGVTKPTLSVPATMLPGIEAMEDGAAALIVDFEGLQGFSAAEFCINMQVVWPGLRRERLTFPGLDARPVFPEVMARALETDTGQEQLADLIRPLLEGAEFLGLPAILGVHQPDVTLARMERLLGARLFEIPTIPPAVPGIRLRELFERELPRLGVRLEPQLKVSKVEFGDSVTLRLRAPMDDIEVEAAAVVLATGRFLSGGLRSDRDRILEPLLGIPLKQPEGREAWFDPDYLGPTGHKLNRVGIETDDAFRPVGPDGAPIDERLFAAGAILSGQDWVRQRCGAGLAIASAYRAVASLKPAIRFAET